MIIQNSKGDIDTVIAYTNIQVRELNKRGVILQECFDYVIYQDSVIAAKDREINNLEDITKSAIKNDSLSRVTIDFQQKEISIAKDEATTFKNLYISKEKETKKFKMKSILFDTFIKSPITLGIGALIGYFAAK